MSLEKLTRELGRAIQQDDRYLAVQKAIEANEQDEELNKQMMEIQKIQNAFAAESEKTEPNQDLLQSYDLQFRGIYEKIMANPNMRAYEKAKSDIDELMTYLTGILALSVNGEDPDTCDPGKHICSDECCHH